jgi:hypothetical protein
MLLKQLRPTFNRHAYTYRWSPLIGDTITVRRPTRYSAGLPYEPIPHSSEWVSIPVQEAKA